MAYDIWARRELDDSEPGPERQTELRSACEANVAAGKAPYDNVEIRTRGELLWIIRVHGWSGDFLEVANNVSLRANVAGADLTGGVNLSRIQLAYANLAGAYFDFANLTDASLIGANLSGAELAAADLTDADLLGADLSDADLTEADLTRARFMAAKLPGAILARTNLSGTDLKRTDLSGADLSEARLDTATFLAETWLDSETLLADVVWNGALLTRVRWERIQRLGDETKARGEPAGPYKLPKSRNALKRLADYETAVRANLQLSAALPSQGLNEHADRFAFRAQRLQRIVLRRQAFLRDKQRRVGLRQRTRALLAYLGSWFLALIAGYGYRPGRSIIAYLLVIFAFASAYFALGPSQGVPFSPLGALVFSVTTFHGRGFFPGGSPGHSITLDDPLTVLAAGQAVLGLIIEVSFIATFTQRFFGR